MSEILSDSKRKQHWVHFTHCPKNNLNIRRVTEPFMVTADATVYISVPDIVQYMLTKARHIPA